MTGCSARVDAPCCTHTGLPYAQDGPHPGAGLVVNNGCAGLPDFAGRHHGVFTRLSIHTEPPPDSLYGTTLAGLRFDALPVDYDHRAWTAHFLDAWPPGTPPTATTATGWSRAPGWTWLSARGAVTCFV